MIFIFNMSYTIDMRLVMNVLRFFTMTIVVTILGACGNAEEQVANQSLVEQTDSSSEGEWRKTGKGADEKRFSRLTNINDKNVKNLSLSWYFDLPEGRGQEATPLVVDGVMYTTAAWSHVFALNPVTGEKLWHFDPKVDKAFAIKGCCGPVNRGLAYSNGKVFIGAYDGRLIALDTKTGKEVWSVQTTDTTQSYTITGAPRIVNGKVLIGNGGAEFGVRGYVSAYDENTGEQVWRFYTVPGHPDKPQDNPIHDETIKTWNGEFWKLGGGGTVWDSMAYDEALNLLYIGVGNSSPWNPKLRTDSEGDNLFVSSIVALNADTGAYVWHYQTTPMDGWDYTATQHMILAELTIEGKERKVIMQAPKNGFFYVLDRQTGEFISAENYVPVNWASGIDDEGRPIINDEAKYWLSDEPSLVTPAWAGGHNWHPMSFNPDTGLVYFPAQELAFPYATDNDFSAKQLAVNLGVDLSVAGFPDDPAIVQSIKDATKGHLAAWDPVQQKEVWRVQYPGMWNGGVLSTAGDLVFQGSATGFFNAYQARTGEKLWEFPAQTGIVAGPITYAIDGEQYVTVSAGWGGIFPLLTGPLALDSDPDPVNRSRLLTFKLGGQASLPKILDKPRNLPDYTNLEIDKKRVERGHKVFESYCASCHGTGAVGGGVTPDLRYSPLASSDLAWKGIVYDGALESRGMVGFSKELSTSDVEDIRHFVIERNQYARSINDVTRTSR
jgi:alcohol dehydrogenase (cytochrome c)/quinohemoprotein ethanol dehydrogenase